MNRNRVLILFVAVLALLVSVGGAAAQGPTPRGNPRAPLTALGTEFTYQGQLKQSGTPVNGVTCDFQFGLYDALTGLTQIGTTQSASALVTNGYFTISNLDFGSGAFNGDARWLDIQVRCPTGSGSYTPLTPRQPLTPAPMALALPGLYTQQNATSPNLIGGYSGNSVTSGVVGATIGGGGASANLNRVTDDYGVVGGGYNNQAGDNAGTTSDKQYATVGGGIYNTASGYGVTVGGGYYNRANYFYTTVPGGYAASATHWGEMAYSSGQFAVAGDAQTSTYVLRNTTSDATATELRLNGSGSFERITIASGRTVTFDILVVGRRDSGNESFGATIKGVIKNDGGTTALVGSANYLDWTNDFVYPWNATASADAANNALKVQVIGAPGKNIRWVATVHTVEVSY